MIFVSSASMEVPLQVQERLGERDHGRQPEVFCLGDNIAVSLCSEF